MDQYLCINPTSTAALIDGLRKWTNLITIRIVSIVNRRGPQFVTAISDVREASKHDEVI